jgi:hypothetical protein
MKKWSDIWNMSSILKITVIRSVHLALQKDGHLAILGLFGFQSSELTFKINEP